jgi:uncharacterized flavoprotein (TIGR03862 family)
VTQTSPQIAIIGAGPAGLIAAERLSDLGRVTVFDRMPSPGRKLLMAGRGGLNLTHSEALERLLTRYNPAPAALVEAIGAFPPQALIEWVQGLGQQVFTGTSGRVFPRAMKASPLLRAWLARLNERGVSFRLRETWQGWNDDGALVFDGPQGRSTMAVDATLLALGGASWPRLGSDGGWMSYLPSQALRPFVPANMGFSVAWSDVFRARYAGLPLKRIGLRLGDRQVMGEAVITQAGIEGGAVYNLASTIRDAIAADGPTFVQIDLRPDLTVDALALRLAGRGSQSLSNALRTKAGLSLVAIGLVQEALHAGNTTPLPELIKALPVQLEAPAGLARAISSAGGLRWEALDDHFMLRARPGVFAAGEMLDWEAPTGGYLLQGCLSTGVAAAQGLRDWLSQR